MVSRRKLPQLTPHLRMVSLAVLLSACLSAARDLSVWKKVLAWLAAVWRGEVTPFAGLFERKLANCESDASSDTSPACDEDIEVARDDAERECSDGERRAGSAGAKR